VLINATKARYALNAPASFRWLTYFNRQRVAGTASLATAVVFLKLRTLNLMDTTAELLSGLQGRRPLRSPRIAKKAEKAAAFK